jgi:hypothetical protein
MEFCNQRELVNQTGHHESEWALVAVKELTDNALDECEEARRSARDPDRGQRRQDRDRRQRARHSGDNDRACPGLQHQGVEPRSVRVAHPRRAGQRVEDPPANGIRAR